MAYLRGLECRKTLILKAFSRFSGYPSVADEKYFNHYFISSCFAPEYLVLQRRVSGVIVICSEITDCGKSEQN